MDRIEFDQKYTLQLNGQQQEAVHATEGAVLLLAVPGSGKTTVLVTRLGYMLCCCGIAANKVLTMTYTVNATKEMKQRFSELFGKDCPTVPEFRTINGVSAKIIEYYSHTHGSGQPFALADDEGNLAKLVADLYRELCGEFATPSVIKELRKWITYVKNMMHSTEEISKLDTGFSQFPTLYQRYCEALRKRHQMDYDDQMVYAKTILEQYEDILAHFQYQYPYICVDESQDTSKIQHAIIHLLAKKTGNIFMVGDEDQSIYGFRAAYPDALMEFENVYPNARVLLMEENYRSTPEITRLADGFIQKNKERHPKTIRPTRASGAAVHTISTIDRASQYAWLVDAAVHGNGQTAVLYRNNDSALPLIDLLDRHGIPFRCKQTDDTFFTHRLVADIADIVAFAHDEQNAEIFLRIYYKFGAKISREAAEYACEKSRSSGKSILLELLRFPQLSHFAKDSVTDMIDMLPNLLQDTAERGLNRIWKDLRYGAYVEQQKQDTNKFDILRLIAKQEKRIDDLFARLNDLRRIVSEPSQQSAPRLLLSTVHSSKGLEYDTVYLLDILDGILPAVTEPSSAEEHRQYEEERRLFYVAMTRAKDQLYLFDCLDRHSAFLKELQQAMPREATAADDVFAALNTNLCGKSYIHATRGSGIIKACCEGRCMIAYPNGESQVLTLGRMFEQRKIVMKLPEQVKDGVKAKKSSRKSNAQPGTKIKLTPEEKKAWIAGAVHGRKIIHTAFGTGSIVSFQDPVISIRFPKFGVKKFVFLDSVRQGLLRYDTGKER